MKLECVRYNYNQDETVGELSINGTFFSYTLEDRVRPPGVKVDGQTAIPEGIYQILLAPFRGDSAKMYPHLQNVPMFSGVCLHGGNDAQDTIGCILVGFNRLQSADGEYHRIYNSAILPLVAKMQEALKNGETIEITVQNGG